MPLDMYAEQILEHYKNPRNKHALPGAQIRFRESNPLCGDVIEVFLKVDGGEVIVEASFDGQGCAISQASASILTEDLKGKTLSDVEAVTKERLLELLGIPVSPTRMKCALLALTAFKAGIAAFRGKSGVRK
ncbi:MAG TPA: iron-sulfur cluster assembly scaffold protein [archaeon]|nr:iron-sulfur cluster assembly scaffold protein [archaeon]